MTMSGGLSDQDWAIRLHIYGYFVARGRPPTSEEVASHFRLEEAEVRAAFHRLHDHHALFLDPGTDVIRMANPLSAVPTAYRVRVGDRGLWANCAWDSLGIPAMLDADARVEAILPTTGEAVNYAVEKGKLKADPFVVHFPLPFARWYDDLQHT